MLEGAHAGRSAAKRTDGDRGGATPRAAGGAHARPTGSRAHRFSRCASRSDRASRARRRGRAVLELRPIVKAGVDLGFPLLGVGILVFDGDEQADGTNARVRVAQWPREISSIRLAATTPTLLSSIAIAPPSLGTGSVAGAAEISIVLVPISRRSQADRPSPGPRFPSDSLTCAPGSAASWRRDPVVRARTHTRRRTTKASTLRTRADNSARGAALLSDANRCGARILSTGECDDQRGRVAKLPRLAKVLTDTDVGYPREAVVP
jgi:hypothetical protein